MGALAIVAGIGTAASIYSQISAGQKEEEAAKKKQELANQQADEILSRELINEQAIRDQAFNAEKEYGAAFSATGREGGGIGGILAIRRNTVKALEYAKRDADFKSYMLRKGAEMDTQLASDAATASYITGAGTALTGAARIYQSESPPSSTTSSLPKNGSSDPYAYTRSR